MQHEEKSMSRHRGLVAALGVGLVLILILGAVAYASVNGPTPAPMTGTIRAPDSGTESGTPTPASLQKLATITAAAADRAALRAIPGTVAATQITEDQGYVVYDVTVAGKDGQKHQVAVDAGNGTILEQSTSDNDGGTYLGRDNGGGD